MPRKKQKTRQKECRRERENKSIKESSGQITGQEEQVEKKNYSQNNFI